MMGFNGFLRIGLQIFCVLCLLIGTCLILTGIFTSGWLVAKQLHDGEVVEHGLIRNCEKFVRPMPIRTSGEFLCFWKFDNIHKRTISNPFQTQREYELYPWQEQVMILLGIACLAALISCFFISSSCCCVRRMFSLVAVFFAFSGAVLSMAGLILFARWANESDFRFYTFLSINVEQEYGWSFYIALGGCLLFCFVFFATIGCAVLSFICDNHFNEKPRVMMPIKKFQSNAAGTTV